MRRLFSDGFNSLAHLVLGVLSIWSPLLFVIFFAYEFIKHPRLADAQAGIVEFMIGYAVALINESSAVFPSLLL